MADKKLTIRIDARDTASRDLKRFNRGLRDTGTQADRTAKKFDGLKIAVGAAMAAFSVRQLAQFGKALFQLGASVGETESKFRTVFGNATASAQEFVDSFATMAGLSQSQAKDAVATMAAIGQGMGQSKKESAEFSEAVVRLAGDLASFNDVPIVEMLRAVQSGLTGEIEPLRRYGIMLDAVGVQQRGAAIAGKGLKEELTDQEKIAGRLALAYEKAGVQVGDLERTQDSAANRARQAAGAWLDLKEAVAETAVGIADLGDELGSITDVLKTAANAVRTDIGLAFYAAGQFLGAKLGEGIADSMADFAAALIPFSHLPGKLGDIYRELNPVVQLWEAAGDAARASADDAVAAMKILGAAERAGLGVGGAADDGGGGGTGTTTGTGGAGTAVVDVFAEELKAATERNARALRDLLRELPVDMARAVDFANLTDVDPFAALRARISVLKAAVADAIDIGTFESGAASDALARELLRLQELLAKFQADPATDIVIEPEIEVGGALTEFGADLTNDFRALGGDLIQGLMSGTADAGDMLKRFMVSFAAKFVMGPFAGALGIFSPSKVMYGFGQNIGAGLALGIDAAGPAVAASARDLADTVIDAIPALPVLQFEPIVELTPTIALDSTTLRDRISADLQAAFDEPIQMPTVRLATVPRMAAPAPRTLSGTADMLGHTAPSLRIEGLPDERANPFSPWIMRWLSDATLQVEMNRG